MERGVTWWAKISGLICRVSGSAICDVDRGNEKARESMDGVELA